MLVCFFLNAAEDLREPRASFPSPSAGKRDEAPDTAYSLILK